MAPRLDLQAVLEELLGSRNVYFQPPESVKLKYPCIVYNRDSIRTDFADNRPYSTVRRYELVVIAADPDSDLVEKVAQLPMCTHRRFYTADNLNHDLFQIFF